MARRADRRPHLVLPLPLVLGLGLASVLLVTSCGGPAIPPQPRPTPMADAEALVRAYYERVREEDVARVMALFTASPELTEPFSDPGDTTVRRGYAEVAEFFAEAFDRTDDHVVPEFVDVRGDDVIVGWSASSRAGEGYSGMAWFRVRRGLIDRLQIRRRE